MSIIFFGSKFEFLAIKNDAHFLTNETIFGVRVGEGAAISEFSREDKKIALFILHPLLSTNGRIYC